MWKDDSKIVIIRNIILVILLIAIAAGMVIAYLNVQKVNEAHDAELAKAYSLQQQEQAASKQQEIDNIQAEYEKDLETLKQYLPGIICWGDSITAGSSGNVSYPSILQKYINAYICNIYDFRDSIQNADDYSRLDWSNYKISVPVVNMGGGDEDSRTVVGRSGVSPYKVETEFRIPATSDPVAIEICSEDGKEVTPLIGGNAGVNNVTICGVEGTLSLDSESYRQYVTRYYFTRLKPGVAVTVPEGTVIHTSVEDQYKDYIHVVCIGTYGGYDSVPQLVEQTKELLSRQLNNPERYIVLGICSTERNEYISYDLESVETAMLQAFGNHYINVRKYLCSDVLTDSSVKISWTDDDKSNARHGIVPGSLRSSTSESELNSTAYEIIGKLVYDRMNSLGYFDEVNEELYITETIKNLIKDDSAYLDKMLTNTLKGLV